MKLSNPFFRSLGTAAVILLWSSPRDAFSATHPLAPTSARGVLSQGQEQVEQFYDNHRDLLSTDKLPRTEEEKKANEAFDALCGQKDCAFSHLYWYRDLESAKAEAKRLHRPILALHLLGKLTDEFSCANSRFFRAIYYSNPDIAKYMKDHFVLYWRTVREVPQVTVKFADGREFHQTITGNSMHTLLSDSGVLIDALPGLSTPANFLEELRQFIEKTPWKEQDATPENIQKFHAARLKETLKRTGDSLSDILAKREEEEFELGEISGFQRAARLSMSKSLMEVPLYKAIGASRRALSAALERTTENRSGKSLEALLHPDSLRFIQLHNPKLSRLAREKFAESLVLDQQINENEQRVIISNWLSLSRPLIDLKQFEKQVYNELFRTPDSDPWLGLNPDDTYSGLLQSGVVQGE